MSIRVSIYTILIKKIMIVLILNVELNEYEMCFKIYIIGELGMEANPSVYILCFYNYLAYKLWMKLVSSHD